MRLSISMSRVALRRPRPKGDGSDDLSATHQARRQHTHSTSHPQGFTAYGPNRSCIPKTPQRSVTSTDQWRPFDEEVVKK